MSRFFACLFLSASVLGAPVQAGVTEVLAADDFVGVNFDLSSGGRYTMFAAAREVNGKVAVCGMVWFENATGTSRATEPALTERIAFRVGGQGLTVNTRAFRRYTDVAAAQAEQKARCAVTSTAWSQKFHGQRLRIGAGDMAING